LKKITLCFVSVKEEVKGVRKFIIPGIRRVKGIFSYKKQIEDSKYLSFADKNDPSGESEDDPEPEDVNGRLWDPGTEDEDEEDDYEDEDENY
jgi:hypothetical protein